MILALDTSGATAGIAVAEDGRPLLEWNWAAHGNHSVTVNRLLDEVLRTLNVRMSNFSSIAVGQGPGSFNGVRVGISLAKGLALACGIPLVGIPSLDALAFAASSASATVTAVIPAGRSEMFLANYCGSDREWRRLGDYHRVSVAEAARMAGPAGVIVGPGIDELREVEPHHRYLGPAWNLPRAAFLAELGRRYFEVGGQDQVHHLEPLYLRLSAAEENRAADRGG